MKWYTDDPIRFEMEKRLIAKKHKSIRMVIEDSKVRVELIIIASHSSYVLAGFFPDDFPYSPMRFYVRSPKLKKNTPHIYMNGMLCLHGEDDVGPETTAKVYIDWAKQWIEAYEKWLDTGEWSRTNK